MSSSFLFHERQTMISEENYNFIILCYIVFSFFCCIFIGYDKSKPRQSVGRKGTDPRRKDREREKGGSGNVNPRQDSRPAEDGNERWAAFCFPVPICPNERSASGPSIWLGGK